MLITAPNPAPEERCQIAFSNVAIAFAGALGHDKRLVAKAMNWYLRGLPPELAVQKVRIDARVAAHLA